MPKGAERGERELEAPVAKRKREIVARANDGLSERVAVAPDVEGLADAEHEAVVPPVKW